MRIEIIEIRTRMIVQYFIKEFIVIIAKRKTIIL